MFCPDETIPILKQAITETERRFIRHVLVGVVLADLPLTVFSRLRGNRTELINYVCEAHHS